jgi:hypothetical protein
MSTKVIFNQVVHQTGGACQRVRVDDATIEYFKALAEEVNVPYQTLINMYLRDCAASRRRLVMKWVPAA